MESKAFGNLIAGLDDEVVCVLNATRIKVEMDFEAGVYVDYEICQMHEIIKHQAEAKLGYEISWDAFNVWQDVVLGMD